MSVSGPTFRLSEERLPVVIELVIEAGHEVSKRLGWGYGTVASRPSA